LAGPKLSAAEIRLLYEQHGAALLLYARSFVVDAAAGEDLVHAVFLKLLRGETSVPHTRNAALRYWLAFSELQDPPGDKATGDTLEKVSAGDAPMCEGSIPFIARSRHLSQESTIRGSRCSKHTSGCCLHCMPNKTAGSSAVLLHD
jgi:Sigma-70 region 2